MRNLTLKYFLSELTGLIIIACSIKDNSNKNFKAVPQPFIETKIDTTNLVGKLSWYHDKTINNKDNTNYKLHFFSLFPKSFPEFISLYGYSEDDKEMPLYTKYEKHINLFCETSSLNKQIFAAKIVAICIKGKWDADAVNMLQECALNFTNEHTLLIAKELNSYGNNEVKSFWYFLFDGPHPAKVIPINIDKIRSSDPRIYRLAKEAFKQVHQESEKHGE